jgi:hypothetical protein
MTELEKIIDDGQRILDAKRPTAGGVAVDGPTLTEWASTAASLIESVFGRDSNQYKKVVESIGMWSIGPAANAVAAAKAVLERGYMFNVRELARADVESDIISQAQVLLEAGYQRAAAVLAGAVLEEHIRSIAPSWGAPTHNNKGDPLTLAPLNDELKKAGTYDSVLWSKIGFLTRIRNEAAHGGEFKQAKDEVEAMLASVIDICDRVRSKQ